MVVFSDPLSISFGVKKVPFFEYIYHNRIVIIKGIPSSFIVVVDPSIRLSFSNRKSSFTDYDSLLNSFGVCLIISLKLPPPQHCGQNRFEKSGWVFFTLFKLFSQLIMYLDFFFMFLLNCESLDLFYSETDWRGRCSWLHNHTFYKAKQNIIIILHRATSY